MLPSVVLCGEHLLSGWIGETERRAPVPYDTVYVKLTCQNDPLIALNDLVVKAPGRYGEDS